MREVSAEPVISSFAEPPQSSKGNSRESSSILWDEDMVLQYPPEEEEKAVPGSPPRPDVIEVLSDGDKEAGPSNNINYPVVPVIAIHSPPADPVPETPFIGSQFVPESSTLAEQPITQNVEQVFMIDPSLGLDSEVHEQINELPTYPSAPAFSNFPQLDPKFVQALIDAAHLEVSQSAECVANMLAGLENTVSPSSSEALINDSNDLTNLEHSELPLSGEAPEELTELHQDELNEHIEHQEVFSDSFTHLQPEKPVEIFEVRVNFLR